MLRRIPAHGATIVLGDMSIQGNIKGLPSLAELMQLALDNGAKRVLVPTANRRQGIVKLPTSARFSPWALSARVSVSRHT